MGVRSKFLEMRERRHREEKERRSSGAVARNPKPVTSNPCGL
jgi:hypothetical protein